MIHFILDRTNSFTIKYFSKITVPDITHRIGIIHYDEIQKLNYLETKALIFADFDRLSTLQLEIVGKIQGELAANYPNLPVFNKVSKYQSRYELLKELKNRKINRYDVFRLDNLSEDVNYPVFLREENEHLGPISPLINSKKELDIRLLAARILGYKRESLMVVEYCDVSDEEGFYKKYSAAIFNDKISPQYLDIEKKWIVKTNVDKSPNSLRLKRFKAFVKDNPHEHQLRKVFKIAGADYGRIDYGLLNNKIQIWEINLNPSFGTLAKDIKSDESVMEVVRLFHRIIEKDIVELDSSVQCHLQMSISSEEERLLRPSKKDSLLRFFHTHLNAKRIPFNYLAYMIKTSALILSRFICFVR